jgi:dihydroorotate dehydrogenase
MNDCQTLTDKAYQGLIRPLLFRQDPEKIHERTLDWLEKAERVGSLNLFKLFYPPVPDLHRLKIESLGLKFPNPIGIAAGLDKNAKVYKSLLSFGFGFVECGTITPRPQPGNNGPRIFRLPEDEALINRLGFNNEGQDALLQRLDKSPKQGIVGINLGKNKDTPNEKAAEDYQRLLTSVWHHASYVVVNISSPNTPNLRELQKKNALQLLLDYLFQTAQKLQSKHPRHLPILLKIAPDLSDEALQDLLEVVRQFPLAGLIATNTTLQRGQLHSAYAQQTGGLSGRPLQALSTQIISKLYRELKGQLPLIGVGGIVDGQSAYEKIRAGATLLQVYTGLVYQGPGLANQIFRELLLLLDKDGFVNLTEAIGADHRP